MRLVFLRRLLLFAGLVSLPIIPFLFLLPRLNLAPVLTDSISYDLKLGFLASQNASRYEVLSVGSSINLNNLHSETLLQAFPEGTTYLNLASFNASVKNSAQLLQGIVPRYRPSTIIMMGNHVDFESSKWQGLEAWQAERYLSGGWDPYFYLRRTNIFSLVQRLRRTRRFVSEARANMQQQLRMDTYGGVPLQVSPENLNPYRQNSEPITEIDSTQYQALKKLCQWLKQKQIKFIYVQSPLKKSNCWQRGCWQLL
ncbi:MAG: hypothetical protein AAFQ68_01685, partial [Bacteroidota bacterium]